MNSAAQIIADQIGGRAFMMLGARGSLVSTENGLQFSIKGSASATKVVVKLDPSDTYTVEFWKGRGLNIKQVASVSDVYADSLRRVIETHTGLYTSL